MEQAIDEAFIRGLIRPRPAEGHKGTFGHALLIAGSREKPGAALLSAMAALRTGCGLLSVMTPAKSAVPLLARLPEAMIIDRKKQPAGLSDYDAFDAVGIGPAIGLNDRSGILLEAVLKQINLPLVIDADALTLLGANRHWYKYLNRNVILTPHPKEFDRLTMPHKSDEERFKAQLVFTATYNVTILLKGHRTCITTPDGGVFRNTNGNSGMATAGSGDALTGIITSLCAQGYDIAAAAQLGAFLHGFAGDRAAAEKSRTSMIASDLIAHIPDFFRQYEC